MTSKNVHSSSFRDPSGYVFVDEGIIKRKINPIYFTPYNAIKSTGFFNQLFDNELLIKHKELSVTEEEIIIQPDQIPFITYPYEWCFNQYKEAALHTLKLQKFALDHNFSLKDASAYNITYYDSKAICIDTLSLDFYEDGKPWRAFKQFIEHFYGPLLLAHYHGSGILKLMSHYIDGIPVKIIASLLPAKTKLNPFIFSNVHLLAKYDNKYNEYQSSESKQKQTKLSKKGLQNIIKALYNQIKKLELKEKSEWGDYYSKTNYTEATTALKSKIINAWIAKIKPNILIDVGGNDGTFVRAIESKVDMALVCDIDNNAVDMNYRQVKHHKESYIMPMVLDVLNPSPAIGFDNRERFSFMKRIREFSPDVTLALALIHHMSLTGTVPFNKSASFFASFSKYLILEFPKVSDSLVQRLLSNKGDFKAHFDWYNLKQFEDSFMPYFDIMDKKEITDSERVLYLFKRK